MNLPNMDNWANKKIISPGSRGGFSGVRDALFPQGFDTLPTPRVPLFTILRYPFLADGPLNFSNEAFGANLY